MAFVERSDEEIFAAWEQDFDQESKAERPSVVIGDTPYFNRELLEKAKRGEQPFYCIMIELLRGSARIFQEKFLAL